MAYLRPTVLPAQKPLRAHNEAPASIFSKNFFENIEKCPVAQYIIKQQGNNDFVKKGNKTELGIHLETCEICSGPAPFSSPVAEGSAAYEITDFAIKKLRAVHRSIDPADISQLILSALADAEMKEEMYYKWQKEIADITEKYEILKAVKGASVKAILFPQQKQVEKQKRDMQSKKIKYLEELLKKDELTIANLKEQNAILKERIVKLENDWPPYTS